MNSADAALNDPCGCNAGLAQELLNYSSNSQIELAYIQQIDEKQYDEIKKGVKASASVLDLVSGSASYDDFQRRRREYLSRTQYSLNTEQSQSLLFSTVRTSDWGDCKRQCIRNQRGFICDVEDVTKTNVAASCSWQPEGINTARGVKVMVNGKELQKESIEPNTTKTWHFQRDASTDLLMTFTLEEGSARTLKIAALPEVQPRTIQPVKLGSCIGRGGVEGVHFWGPEGEVCNGIPPWGRYASISTSSPSRICSCTGHGGVEGVRLWGPEGEVCAGIPAWRKKYSEQCVSLSNLSVCGCVGHGSILEGQILWGPKNNACGGMSDPGWGQYTQYCVQPR